MERSLHRLAREMPAGRIDSRGLVARLGFHARSAVRNSGEIAKALIDSLALLLTLSLPALSAAAVAPTLVIVFLPNLMSNWPSLEDPAIGLVDPVRTDAFISTIGALSGALTGGWKIGRSSATSHCS